MSTPGDSELPGFSYDVSDEQLRTFAAQSVERRMQWLEEKRRFTWETASPETRERWKKLREYPSIPTAPSGPVTPRK